MQEWQRKAAAKESPSAKGTRSPSLTLGGLPGGVTLRHRYNWVGQDEIVDTISEPTDTVETLVARHQANKQAAWGAVRPHWQTGPFSAMTEEYKFEGSMVMFETTANVAQKNDAGFMRQQLRDSANWFDLYPPDLS